MTAVDMQFAVGEVGDNVVDRRNSPWFDAKFAVQITITIVTVVISSYIASQVRTAVLERVAVDLKEKAVQIEGQVNVISASVQSVSRETGELRVKFDAANRDIADMKSENARRTDMFEARIISLEKTIAEMKGRLRQ